MPVVTAKNREPRRYAAARKTMISTPATSARPRCSNGKVLAAATSHSGHERQVLSDCVATTLEPLSRSTYVAMTAAVASRLNDGLSTPGDSGIDRTAVAMRQPTMIMARPRWTATSHGVSSLTTTTPPRPPSTATAISEAVASHATIGLRERYTAHAATTVAMMSTPVIAPTVRWEYSMIAFRSAGGYGRPWHSGQSGQPRPEPVTRTTPPSAIWR